MHNICFNTDVLPKAKMKACLIILKGSALDNYLSKIGISDTIINSNEVCYSMSKKWIRWNKTQNEMDDTKIKIY